MKKFFEIFLTIILIISMTACNNTPEVVPTDDATIPVTTDETVVNEDPIETEGTEPEDTIKPTDPNHEHIYTENVVVGTCTEDGYTEYVCECGETYNDNYVFAVGHTWGDWLVIVEPTEDQEGTAERSCARCNEFNTKTLPKEVQGHTHEYTESLTREPTCRQSGEKTFECACGNKYMESIEKLAHDYEKTVTEPTCTSKGYTTRTCKNCFYSYRDSYVSAKEHNYTSNVTVEPTCSKVGTMTYTCDCGKTYTADIEKAKHDYSSKVVDPTCTERGYTVYTCACGDTYKENYVNAYGHKWSNWKTTKEATETSEGSAERVCSTCNAKDTKTIAKVMKDHVHSYSDKVTKAATCSAAGVKTFTCSCGNSYTESIAKLAHSYASKVVAPTCAEKGYTEYVCDNCGDSYRDTYTNTLSHKYNSAVTVEATCSKVGVRTHTCSACGSKYTEDIEKVNHTYSKTVTNPTCDNEGYTTYKCDKCGHTYVGDKVSAVGHTYNNTVVKPTCESKGYTKHTCTRCAYSYVGEEVSATGHSYKVTSNTATCADGGTKTETCSACGDQRTSSSEATGHVDTKTETVDASCIYDGYTKVICTACGTVVSNTKIPANGAHEYETKKMSDAAQSYADKGYYDYFAYVNFKDWKVNVCKHCEYIEMETLRFAHSDRQAASIMLGYVNSLRESVYGTSEYNLELNSTLIELAKIRAKEISVVYGHGGTYTNASENIAKDCGINIYDQYAAWCNSSGHYKNMITPTHKYFGYALYKSTDCWSTAGIYGVQLFWNPSDKAIYGG